MPRKLSHYDRTGKARMVDVSDKSVDAGVKPRPARSSC